MQGVAVMSQANQRSTDKTCHGACIPVVVSLVNRLVCLPQTKDILERLTQDPEQVAKRPLLAGDDPEAKLDAILEKRRSQYGQVRDRLNP